MKSKLNNEITERELERTKRELARIKQENAFKTQTEDALRKGFNDETGKEVSEDIKESDEKESSEVVGSEFFDSNKTESLDDPIGDAVDVIEELEAVEGIDDSPALSVKIKTEMKSGNGGLTDKNIEELLEKLPKVPNKHEDSGG